MRKKISRPVPTLAELRATLDAAKIVAMNKFEADWGTRDIRVVAEALRQSIPQSSSPQDALRKAQIAISGR